MKTLAALVALLISLATVSAQTFLANMNGAQDGGGARQGSGSVTLTLSGTTLSLNGSFSGITVPATAAHIHGPGTFGQSVGVIYDLGGGIIPLGGTSGSISGSVTLVPKGTAGSYTVAQQMTDLNNSLWYINIHDNSFPGGEIRGQIIPVPEPSTLALGGMGVVALLVLARRRSR